MMRRLRLYRWQGIDNRGEILTGLQLNSSKQLVIEQLLCEEIITFHLTAVGHTASKVTDPQHLILFFRQLSSMLAAGLTLANTLELLSTSQQIMHWRVLTQLMLDKITTGKKLSDVMTFWPQIFPPISISLISAGEITGHLEQSCQRLAELLERQWKIKKKIIQTLRYPCITLLLLIVITTGLILFILPEFSIMYQSLNTPLPFFTELLLNITHTFTRYLPHITVVSATGILCFRLLDTKHPSWKLNRHRFLMQLPAFGRLWQWSHLTLFFSTLTIAQQSGLTLLEGLALLDDIFASPLWKTRIAELKHSLHSGEKFSAALEHHQEFPALSILLIRSAEQTGQLENAFLQLSMWYQQQSDELSQQLTNLLEPLMLVVSGILIGSVVIAMYLPIFYLGDALG